MKKKKKVFHSKKVISNYVSRFEMNAKNYKVFKIIKNFVIGFDMIRIKLNIRNFLVVFKKKKKDFFTMQLQ